MAGPSANLTRARQNVPLSHFAGLLGINGLTAWLALHSLGRPEEGNVLLSSTAAGSVGSLVGQFGKLAGCTTVGLTGGADKVQRCVDRFGYDQAFDYKIGEIGATLDTPLPQGADIYFDNTGGEIFDAA